MEKLSNKLNLLILGLLLVTTISMSFSSPLGMVDESTALDIEGSDGDDSLSGTNEDDTINSGDGNDDNSGLDGNDELNSGDEEDLYKTGE